MTRCNCGAKHTSFKNTHADWCDVIRHTNRVVLENFGRMEFRIINDSKIKVIIKDGDTHIADLDYSWRRGDFEPGVMSTTINGSDMKSAILQCVDYLKESINDDRIDRWIPLRTKAKQEWNEKNQPPPTPKSGEDWMD